MVSDASSSRKRQDDVGLYPVVVSVSILAVAFPIKGLIPFIGQVRIMKAMGRREGELPRKLSNRDPNVAHGKPKYEQPDRDGNIIYVVTYIRWGIQEIIKGDRPWCQCPRVLRKFGNHCSAGEL
jgi:hypothetical protein